MIKKVKKYSLWVCCLVMMISLPACSWNDYAPTEWDDQFFIRRSGADLPVWIHGNRASKVFILTVHGGPILGSGLDFRRGSYTEELEQKYAMVYWDQRHSGSAHGRFSKEQLKVDEYVRDLDFLVDVLKDKYGDDISLFLLGHSWGGMLTAKYLSTENFQNNFKGWINMSGVLDVNESDKNAIRWLDRIIQENVMMGVQVGVWEEQLEALQSIDTSTWPLDFSESRDLYAIEKDVLKLVKDVLKEEQYRSGFFRSSFLSPSATFNHISNVLTAFGSLNKDFKNQALTSRLNRIHLPTLLIYGKYDFSISPEVGEAIFQGISSESKELSIYEFSTHEASLTEPERFNMECIHFIETHK